MYIYIEYFQFENVVHKQQSAINRMDINTIPLSFGHEELTN